MNGSKSVEVLGDKLVELDADIVVDGGKSVEVLGDTIVELDADILARVLLICEEDPFALHFSLRRAARFTPRASSGPESFSTAH